MISLETKVGLFAFLACAIAAVSLMKVSDVQLERRYTLYFLFDDVKGLQDKSPVKIAGVEIGRVDEIMLEEGKAKIKAKIKKDVPIYANGKVRVKITGIIGSQFLDVNPGTVEARRLENGDTLYGSPSKSLEDLIDKISEFVEGKEGKPGIGDHLTATMSNLHSITDTLNESIGLQKTDLKEMIHNFHQFSVDIKGMAQDMHELTSSKKQDIEVSITKLRSLLERLDEIVAKIQKGEGSVGKLLADKQMGDEVKQTVSNLKETSESAKEVLGRFTKIRSFWEAQARAVPGASTVRGDAGIRLQPRVDKYYYLGINNAGDRKYEFKDTGDFEKKNTITAVLGKQFGPVTLEVGAIRSSAGVGLKYYPFQFVNEKSGYRWASNIELNTQAFDFSRDETRGLIGQERKFKGSHVNLGAKYKATRWMYLGAAIEDVGEIAQLNLNTHLVFEDKDLAYLFGFVSFAR